MLDFTKVKLGKKPPRIDSRTLKLARYLLPTLSPSLPDVDYTFGVTEWGEMLNDQLGDCTIAGAGHAEQVWSVARGGEYTLPDEAILQKYEQWCAYDPADPSTDQGGIELDVLNAWRKAGFWKHPLTAHADVDPTNLEHVKKAIELFGGVYIGVQLPLSAQGASEWDASHGPDAEPGSWGGHCVFIPKYRVEEDKVIFTCITWGELTDITQDFWLYSSPDPKVGPYIDEVHALIAPEFLSLKTGNTPEGFDLTTLEADLKLVTG